MEQAFSADVLVPLGVGAAALVIAIVIVVARAVRARKSSAAPVDVTHADWTGEAVGGSAPAEPVAVGAVSAPTAAGLAEQGPATSGRPVTVADMVAVREADTAPLPVQSDVLLARARAHRAAAEEAARAAADPSPADRGAAEREADAAESPAAAPSSATPAPYSPPAPRVPHGGSGAPVGDTPPSEPPASTVAAEVPTTSTTGAGASATAVAQPAPEQAAAGRSDAERSAAERPAEEATVAEQAGHPAAGHSAGEQAAAGRPAAGHPTTEQSAASAEATAPADERPSAAQLAALGAAGFVGVTARRDTPAAPEHDASVADPTPAAAETAPPSPAAAETASPSPAAAETAPPSPAAAETAAPADLAGEHLRRPDVTPARPRPAVAQPGEEDRTGSGPAVASAVQQALAARARAAQAGQAVDPRRGDARDRLLAVLLNDPVRAVGATVDLQSQQQELAKIAEAMRVQRAELGAVVRRLADAGLSGDQVAKLAGLDPAEVTELLGDPRPR